MNIKTNVNVSCKRKSQFFQTFILYYEVF